MAKKKKHARKRPPFKRGDIVISSFYAAHADVRRVCTEIKLDPNCASGWSASADAGPICPTCHRPSACPIRGVDSEWFKKQ